MRSIEVPFDGQTLPGYHLKIDDAARPTVVMIGGGDSYREDLFAFVDSMHGNVTTMS